MYVARLSLTKYIVSLTVIYFFAVEKQLRTCVEANSNIYIHIGMSLLCQHDIEDNIGNKICVYKCSQIYRHSADDEYEINAVHIFRRHKSV